MYQNKQIFESESNIKFNYFIDESFYIYFFHRIQNFGTEEFEIYGLKVSKYHQRLFGQWIICSNILI